MSNINPDHYKMAGGREAYEVIGDVCDTLESRGVGGAEIYYIGSALKYLLRYGAKGDADEQARKAIRFLQMALPEEEGDGGDLTVTCDSENAYRVTFSSEGCLCPVAAHRDECADDLRTVARDDIFDALAQEAEAIGVHYY